MQKPTEQEDVVQDATDSEIELMLDDAYDVPAVSRSLLKRLDRAVEQEWGVSPGLSRRRASMRAHTAAGTAGRGSRLLRAWPVVTCVGLILLAVVIFQNNAHAYGFARMMDALSRAKLVEITEADGLTVRWMSLPKAVVGRRSAGGSRLLDFDQGLMLQRDADDKRISRRAFRSAAGASRQAAIVTAFLLNNVTEDGDAVRQTNLLVIDENWSSADNGDVVLRVRLGSETDTAELMITVDRQTHLPKSFASSNVALRDNRISLFYPEKFDATDYLSTDFPADMPVVDASASAEEVAADGSPPQSPQDVVAVVNDSDRGDEPAAVRPPDGAASLQWKPVAKSNWSSDESIERINQILAAVWQEHSIQPAGPASDEELLRRVYLDLAGRTPSVSEVRAYLADGSTNRYVKLVDRLLASRDHATHLATVWRTYLIPEGIDLSRFGGTETFEEWCGQQFIDREPYDEIVRRLLLAEGRLTQSGPLLFYAAVKLDPDQLAARSSRVFLGMRLDCAQCHDDHFEPWLQEDFWGYAAFFAQISRPQGALNNVSTVMRVRDIQHGEVRLPESETIVSPRFLDGSPVDKDAASRARRRQLAEWLTADDNPFFSRATANRVWGLLFGKGIVDPVDGFGQQHEPVSQELLDHLASHFISNGYDLRALFRTIVLSRAYRLSSGAKSPDPRRHDFFAQMNVKLLTAEQMYDCITVASMLVSAESGSGFNLNRVGNSRRDQFLQQFRSPPGRPTEYLAGIPQALTLMNGGLIGDATGLVKSGLLKSLEIPLISNQERIEILYLATLSRRLTPSEQELLNDYISEDVSGSELFEALSDVLWALLNSAEFTMNH